jgi:hypothetical protein
MAGNWGSRETNTETKILDMAAHQASALPTPASHAMTLVRVATFPRLRALAWHDDFLYASRGYTLLRARMNAPSVEWQEVARYSPVWWRNLSVPSRFTFRLFRDGFHALAVLASGHIVAAVPGAILALAPGESEFRVSHRVLRGTRPLHIAVTPDDHVFWGEYFDNPRRDEVHIYVSTDRGVTWNVAYTFARGAIRHVHNIVYDEWAKCLWVLTGDDGPECRILRVSCDFRNVDVVLAGNQQARAVALVPTPEGLYFSSDTPLESNHVYCLDRGGKLTKLAPLGGSSIYGCRVGEAIFFSTMVEPSQINLDPNVRIYGSCDGFHWQDLLHWRKDVWPMSLFQYGNAFLPDGRNTTEWLAVTTVAVLRDDLTTSIWHVLHP